MVHKLLQYLFVPQNLPPYQYFAECECGFQTRCSSEQAAKSQINNHIMRNGGNPAFVDEQKKEEAVTAQPVKPVFNPFKKK